LEEFGAQVVENICPVVTYWSKPMVSLDSRCKYNSRRKILITDLGCKPKTNTRHYYLMILRNCH
jgi:hypothetical protein